VVERTEPASPAVLSLEEIDWETARYPDEDFDRGEYRDIGGALASRTIGANIHRLQPGQENARYHTHEMEEELFLVLDGSPTLRLDGRVFHLNKGHAVYCPPGSAHTFRNEGEEPCSILMTSNRCGRADAAYPLWQAEPRPDDLSRGLDPSDARVQHVAQMGWESDPFGRKWGGTRNLTKALKMQAIGAEIRTMRPGGLARYRATTCAEALYLVLEGEVEMLLDGEEHDLREGGAVWVPPGSGYAFRVRSPAKARIFSLMDRPPSDAIEFPTPPAGWEEPSLV